MAHISRIRCWWVVSAIVVKGYQCIVLVVLDASTAYWLSSG